MTRLVAVAGVAVFCGLLAMVILAPPPVASWSLICAAGLLAAVVVWLTHRLP